MAVHTIDPVGQLADHTIREYLTNVADSPIRYEDANGRVTNTRECRGLIAWYVLIEHDTRNDAVLVAPIRLGLGTGGRGFTTRQYLREAARIAPPDGADRSAWDFRGDLGVEVGRALGEIKRVRAESHRG